MTDKPPSDHVDGVVSALDREFSYLSCSIGGERTTLRVATSLLPENAMYGSPVRISVNQGTDPPSLSIVPREITPEPHPEVDELMAWVESL